MTLVGLVLGILAAAEEQTISKVEGIRARLGGRNPLPQSCIFEAGCTNLDALWTE